MTILEAALAQEIKINAVFNKVDINSLVEETHHESYRIIT